MSQESRVKSQKSKVRVASEVVEVAQSLVGTPYAFQQRSREHGCDCLGLILLVGWELELFDFDIKNYSSSIGNQLEEGLNKYCEPLPDICPGAIALFAIANVPQHCGIITNYRDGWGIVHAYQNVGKVREHQLIKWWQDKIVAVYALPNVNYF